MRPQTLRRSLSFSLALAAAAIAAPARADLVTYNGTTVGAPVFNRPVPNGTSAPTSLSGVGIAVAYHVELFTVDAAGPYWIQSGSTLAPGWDNVTLLYANGFDPNAPLANILLANDDNPTVGLSGFNGVALTPGVVYALVTTGFSNADVGAFTNTIQGPGVITLGVPEPGPIALAGVAGLAGLSTRLIRRRRRAA